MAFTIKDWQDSPSVVTPISATALENLETRLSDYSDSIGRTGQFNITKAPYNCDPTGVADSTAGLTQAITDATGSATIKTIYAPVGTYKLTAALPWASGLRLVGDGMWGQTVFKPTGVDPTTNPGLSFIWWDTSNGTTSGAPLSNIEFKDFEVDGSAVSAPGAGTASSKGFQFEHVKNARFTNVYVHDVAQTGFAVAFCYESVVFSGCYAKLNGRLNSGSTGGGGGFVIGTHGVDTDEEPATIIGCHAVSNKRFNIVTSMSGGTGVLPSVFSSGARIVGNYCSGGQVGIGEAGGRRTVITGNTVTGASVAGIQVGIGTGTGKPGYDTVIANNAVYGNTGEGIQFAFLTANVIATGPTLVTGNDVSGNLHGIHCLMDTADVQLLKISNNTIHNNGRDGIRFVYGGSTNTALLRRSQITGNTVYNNATLNTSGDRSGISVNVTASDVAIDQNVCYDTNGTKLQYHGIILLAGTTFTGGSVRGNDVRDNLNGLALDATISATTALGSNPGQSEGIGDDSPIGAGEVVGASPWTRAAPNAPETLYVYGGGVTLITINGANAAVTSNVHIPLEAGDDVIITYGTVPVVKARRRY